MKKNPGQTLNNFVLIAYFFCGHLMEKSPIEFISKKVALQEYNQGLLGIACSPEPQTLFTHDVLPLTTHRY
jgi:hypothetical protein